MALVHRHRCVQHRADDGRRRQRGAKADGEGRAIIRAAAEWRSTCTPTFGSPNEASAGYQILGRKVE
jgi:hypothetical protein